MQPVSAKWNTALTTDHGSSVKVNVLYDGLVVAEDIDFEDGAVKVDRGSDVRRSLSLSIADPSKFPVSATDPYAVYGQRIYVEGGLTYLDGSSERVPLGTFVITSVSGNIHTGPIEVEGSGLEILLKRSVWDTAQSTDSWGSIAGFLEYHIEDTIPDVDFIDLSTHGLDPIPSKTWDAQSDKWTALTEAANSIGCEVYCNANGTFVLADIPDPDDFSIPPVWDVTTGDTGVMVSADMELTADEVFNRVVVTGENAEDDKPPVQAEAKIEDPADPLRYSGPFGQVTKAYSSSLIVTANQAAATANAMLAKYRAPNRTVSLATVPNPAIDAGDRIRVDYGSAHPPEIHIVHSFEVPLSATAGGSTISTVGGREDGGD